MREEIKNKLDRVNEVVGKINENRRELAEKQGMILKYRKGKTNCVLLYLLLSAIHSIFFESIDSPSVIQMIISIGCVIIAIGCMIRYFKLESKIDTTTIDKENIYEQESK